MGNPRSIFFKPRYGLEFYRERYNDSLSRIPNPAHLALVKLENFLGDNFLLVTQIIDRLHHRAGSQRVLEMHGSLSNCLCTKCQSKLAIKDIDLNKAIPLCPYCQGFLRPDIVWLVNFPLFGYD